MINFFLNQNNNFVIELFSIYHFLFIFVTFLIIDLIILDKDKFLNLNIKQKKNIRFLLSTILIINFILRRGSFIYYGVYNWKYHLDINFCNFTSLLFFLYCITGSKKIYSICYYFAFIGPLLSILIPSSNLSPLNYSFYSFLILHHIIFIFNIIFMFIENYKYNKKDLQNTILFLLLYIIIIYIFNFIVNTTYNMPLTFVNINILNLNFINILLDIKYIEFFIMFLVIYLLIYSGKIFLKYFNK